MANNKFEKTPLIEHSLQKLDISNNPIELGIPKSFIIFGWVSQHYLIMRSAA
ncbi:hypothetical protein GTU79_15270 [Sodalis ligni]|nr:hypothetical protein GTU79_15270 [Sodalis ligni]